MSRRYYDSIQLVAQVIITHHMNANHPCRERSASWLHPPPPSPPYRFYTPTSTTPTPTQGEPIDGLVNERNLPVELGGLAEWSIEAYIAERCREEGICPDAAQGERRYKGRALINLAL